MQTNCKARFQKHLHERDYSNSTYINSLEKLTQLLNCTSNSLGDLFIDDCLWQSQEPFELLKSIDRALKPEATVVFLEPLMSPVSYTVAVFKHPIGLDLKSNPFKSLDKENYAIPSLIFDRIENRLALLQAIPSLTFKKRERIAITSGLICNDSNWHPKLLKLDRFLLPFIGNFCASHMLVELSKK
ncbi:MAG: hypothetical protein R3261_00225 [Alphaproteobacteria bacterium]|nr:hypothetical protein [Alphaproteobacteria bacterium]